MTQREVTVYLDVCCLNRPFDDQTQPRIRLETEAVTLIVTRVRAAEWRWISSEAATLEIAAGPTGARRQWIEQLLVFTSETVPVSKPQIERSQQLVAPGFRAMDALHLACAERGGADVFLTTDDRLLQAARRASAQLRVIVRNPARWLEEVTSR